RHEQAETDEEHHRPIQIPRQQRRAGGQPEAEDDRAIQQHQRSPSPDHGASPRQRALRATRWPTVALASSTSSQTNSSLTTAATDSAPSARPKTINPRPRLSTLVSAWMRV